MKTDKQKLIDLFNEFGVKFEVLEKSGDQLSSVSLTVDQSDENSKVTGYRDFCSFFYFEENGKFTKVGIWEE